MRPGDALAQALAELGVATSVELSPGPIVRPGVRDPQVSTLVFRVDDITVDVHALAARMLAIVLTTPTHPR